MVVKNFLGLSRAFMTHKHFFWFSATAFQTGHAVVITEGNNLPHVHQIATQDTSVHSPEISQAIRVSLASSLALPVLKVAVDDECSGKGLVVTENNKPADWLIRWAFPNSWGFPYVSAASRAYTVHRRNLAYKKQRLFCFRSSEHACRSSSSIAKVWSVKDSMLFKDHTRHDDRARYTTISLERYTLCQSAMLFFPFIFFGLMCNFF